MTNFIYNMQDELFHLNMILPVGEFSPIKKLVDHIEAQGKQLRELNAAITKRNKTIEKYEREKETLQKSNSYLIKKVDELNNGIRNSEDLTWKQKYDALLHSSEQAIGALQKKCQEYKNSESEAITSTIETLVKENKELKEEINLYIGVTNTKNEEVEALAKAVRCPWGNNAEIISAKTARIKELEEKVKQLDARIKELVILCDEEYDKNKEFEEKNKKIEENFKKLEHDYNELIKQRNALVDENKKLERSNLDLGDTIGLYVEEFKKLKEDLEKEKQVNKDLNMVINSKNKLLDEYMTKCNNLEQIIKKHNEEQIHDMFSTASYLTKRCNKAEETLSKIRDLIDGKE